MGYESKESKKMQFLQNNQTGGQEFSSIYLNCKKEYLGIDFIKIRKFSIHLNICKCQQYVQSL